MSNLVIMGGILFFVIWLVNSMRETEKKCEIEKNEDKDELIKDLQNEKDRFDNISDDDLERLRKELNKGK